MAPPAGEALTPILDKKMKLEPYYAPQFICNQEGVVCAQEIQRVAYRILFWNITGLYELRQNKTFFTEDIDGYVIPSLHPLCV